MSWFRKDRKPRIAYRLQRDGTRIYFVEVWACYESGCMWSQDSKETTSLKTAHKYLKEITDKEIIGHYVLTEGGKEQ